MFTLSLFLFFLIYYLFVFFFFSSRRRHTRYWRDWSSDVCSSDLVADRPLTEVLAEHLEPRRTLLVLDNCEHLVGGCAALADTLLRACPDLKILATSREPLRIAGEAAWPVPSLSLPDPRRRPPTKELARYEAVRLFVERAEAADAGFELTERNAMAVARLCRELDGIPLAIELAAARMRALTVEQIFQRLEEPLNLLTTGSRTAAPRPQTLRAALEWSFELLDDQERELLGRLSVLDRKSTRLNSSHANISYA